MKTPKAWSCPTIAFQYDDFKLPWEQRKGIAVTPNFEREIGLAAYRAWENKQDRHPY